MVIREHKEKSFFMNKKIAAELKKIAYELTAKEDFVSFVKRVLSNSKLRKEAFDANFEGDIY